MSAVIHLIPYTLADSAWRVAAPWLEPAAAHGGHDMDAIKHKIDKGYAMLLVAMTGSDGGNWNIAGAVVVEKEDHRLHATLIGGQHVHQWAGAMVGACKALARRCDKRYLTGAGRLGWYRLLRRYGFRRWAGRGGELGAICVVR